jgi:hypothetical protein
MSAVTLITLPTSGPADVTGLNALAARGYRESDIGKPKAMAVSTTSAVPTPRRYGNR